MEPCERCGEVGEDRRTLWMACFYDMTELKVPFKNEVLLDTDSETLTRVKDPLSIPVGGNKINLTSGTVRCSGELHPRPFHTLRVCKKCRAEWMEAIEKWFNFKCENTLPSEPMDDADIPVRINGTIRYMTEEQWHQMKQENK